MRSAFLEGRAWIPRSEWESEALLTIFGVKRYSMSEYTASVRDAEFTYGGIMAPYTSQNSLAILRLARISHEPTGNLIVNDFKE